MQYCGQQIARLTFEEFLEWPGENQHVEWVDGYVVEKDPPYWGFAELSGFLYKILDEYVLLKELGTVRQSPFNMKTGPNLPGRAPSVLFAANGNRAYLLENYLDGPADLVVEVLRSGHDENGWTDRRREYEAGGVPEYWYFDPKTKNHISICAAQTAGTNAPNQMNRAFIIAESSKASGFTWAGSGGNRSRVCGKSSRRGA